MTTILIDDLDDPRLCDFELLNQKNLTRFSGKFIVEGRLLVERLIDSHFEIESIVATPHTYNEFALRFPMEANVFVLEKSLVSAMTGFQFHRGILACALRRPTPLLSGVIEPGEQTIVICPEITDQANLGGVLRNCAAFGVSAIILGKGCADPFSRRVIRVSMGAAFSLPIIRSDDLKSCLQQLKDGFGFDLIATVLDANAEPLVKASRTMRTALLFGNEGDGLAQTWIDLSSRQVTLPMRRGTDSLNLATATGVFLYHFTTNANRDDFEVGPTLEQ